MFEGTAFDIFLHGSTVVVALVLLAVSYRAYTRKRSDRFRYVIFAFGLFALKEVILTLTILGFLPYSSTWATHFLNLAIILAFFRGTV